MGRGQQRRESFAHESSDERFKAVFGTHRTTFSSRPEDLRFPDEKDWAASGEPIGFLETSHLLHHLEVENDDTPFLWVTDGAGRSHKHISYCGSHNTWRENPTKQIAWLALALHGELRDAYATYGPEWVLTSTGGSSERLCFPPASGQYARLVQTALSDHVSYWGAQEIRSDPVRAWDEITHALAHGV